MLLHLLPAIFASVLGAAGCQDQPTVVRVAQAQADMAPPQDTTLTPHADTYIRQGSPNQNQGAELILRLQSSGKNRALLRWDQQTLVQAVAVGTLSSARLELTIADLGDNWSAQGRTIELHRMTQAWTELGATWNCAVDTVPGDSKAECTGATAWDMDHSAAWPFVAETTATALLRNGQTGVVTFDVTADVQAWLAGQPNDGWILKKTVEGDPGKVDFGSRESGAGPRLVVSVVAGDTARPPIPAAYNLPGEGSPAIVEPSDTSIVYYRTVVLIRFDDSASGATVRGVLAGAGATIIGGARGFGAYIVRVPDPGATVQALDSLLHRLEAQPGVEIAAPLTLRPGAPVIHARYPTDGVGATRQSWFDAVQGSGTWSREAIRAPLAWGCETGNYGGSRMRLGVADYVFDASQPDLRSNVAAVRPVAPGIIVVHSDSLDVPRYFVHGTAVAGVMAATGDNGVGVAGTVWGADTYLYALAKGDSIPTDMVLYLIDQVLPAAKRDSIRLMVSAADFPVAGSLADRQVTLIDKALQTFVSGKPGALFVFSAGDDATKQPVSDFAGGLVPRVTGIQTAVARIVARHDPDAARIVVVAATDRANQLASFSNFLQGGTDIAAPGVDVLTLVPTAYAPEGVAILGGTSMAAPFVGGVAAMIWGMDPDLEPDSVKSYILRGARVPRLSPGTGQLVSPTPVTGAETVYQLDAYGALSLLSAERPGTPICGYPVGAGNAPGTIILEPPGSSPRTLTVPGATFVSGLSVAQGGRLISVYNYDYAAGASSILIDQTGRQIGSPLAGVERRFLENGTVDITYDPAYLPVFTIRRGDGDSTVFNPFHDVGLFATPPSYGFGDIAPSGDVAALVAQTTENITCGQVDVVRHYLVPLGASVLNEEGEVRDTIGECPPLTRTQYGSTSLAWSHDGRRAVFFATKKSRDNFTGLVDLFQTTIMGGETVNGGEPQTVPGLFIDTPRFSADDSLVTVGQSDIDANCQVALRRVDAPWTVVGTPVAGQQDIDCGAYIAPVQANLRLAGANAVPSAARQAVAVSRADGFSLTAAALLLHADRRWARVGARGVQVN